MKLLVHFLLALGLLVLPVIDVGASSLQESGELRPFIPHLVQPPEDEVPEVATDGESLSAEIAKAEKELEARRKPSVGLYGSAFRDKNEITVMHGGLFAAANFLDAVNARLFVMTGQLHQDAKGQRRETNIWRTAASLGVTDLFLTPRIIVWGAAGYETFTLNSPESQLSMDSEGNLNRWSRTPMYRGYLVGGRLGGKYVFGNESELGLEVKRESFWAEHDKFDTRVFNRVEDMTKMAADMAANKGRIFANIVTFPEQQLHLDGGFDSLEDGNFRRWGYAHYQFPVLWSQDKHWTALRPNFYVESCSENKPGYFSPDSHITTGIMLHTIHNFKYVDLEAEVNPQLLWTRNQTKNGETQEGVHGLVNITYKYEGLRLGVGGFAYADTDNYWIYRANVFLKYTF